MNVRTVRMSVYINNHYDRENRKEKSVRVLHGSVAVMCPNQQHREYDIFCMETPKYMNGIKLTRNN